MNNSVQNCTYKYTRKRARLVFRLHRWQPPMQIEMKKQKQKKNYTNHMQSGCKNTEYQYIYACKKVEYSLQFQYRRSSCAHEEESWDN